MNRLCLARLKHSVLTLEWVFCDLHACEACFCSEFECLFLQDRTKRFLIKLLCLYFLFSALLVTSFPDLGLHDSLRPLLRSALPHI